MSNKSFYVSPIINSMGGGGNNTPLRSQVLHSKTDSKVNAKTANTITLQSHTKDSTLESKSNLKVYIPNSLTFNAHKPFTPSFLSLICASVLLTLPYNVVAKDNWVLLGNTGLDTTDANTNKVTSSLTNKQISASQNKEYKNLEITNSGSITNTNANY
ncbi:hypothetical protein LS72_003335, partial [Helicobacter apodemus]